MTIQKFQKTILDWYKTNGRELPWRNTFDPYKILVSEVMLQQTQVSRVLPKYKEFLKEFPTLEKLANAQNKKLLKVWDGLGYWKRALNLKQTAKLISIKKKQLLKFCTPTELEKLPGIGHYTARALACFAFGNTEAFLDTNIRRVYLHFFFPLRPIRQAQGKQTKKVSDKEILPIAQKSLASILCHDNGLRYPKITPREWHYALFDYGAAVLKDKKINKRSRHYHKQSKFEGSFRSFRTKVMRFLLDQPNQTTTRSKVRLFLKKTNSPYTPEKVLRSLEKDGLIKNQRNSYSL